MEDKIIIDKDEYDSMRHQIAVLDAKLKGSLKRNMFLQKKYEKNVGKIVKEETLVLGKNGIRKNIDIVFEELKHIGNNINKYHPFLFENLSKASHALLRVNGLFSDGFDKMSMIFQIELDFNILTKKVEDYFPWYMSKKTKNKILNEIEQLKNKLI